MHLGIMEEFSCTEQLHHKIKDDSSVESFYQNYLCEEEERATHSGDFFKLFYVRKTPSWKIIRLNCKLNL